MDSSVYFGSGILLVGEWWFLVGVAGRARVRSPVGRGGRG